MLHRCRQVATTIGQIGRVSRLTVRATVSGSSSHAMGRCNQHSIMSTEGLASKDRTEYPNCPKVGIGVVLLRNKSGQNEVGTPLKLQSDPSQAEIATGLEVSQDTIGHIHISKRQTRSQEQIETNLRPCGRLSGHWSRESPFSHVVAGVKVLLVRRGKEPEKGMLTFPGGSLELGETMAECAARELMEETGLKLLNQPPVSEPGPRLLSFPRPVDAIDIIRHDDKGRLRFHYTIVDMAALPEEAEAQPEAADDAAEVLWVPVQHLRSLADIGADHARIAEAACDRFDIPTDGNKPA